MKKWNFKDLTGEKYGRLKVLERVENSKTGRSRWKCECKCGEIKIIDACALRSGATQSCGCLHKDRLKEKLTKHNGTNTRLYRIYHNIKARCYNTNSTKYSLYGGRGITVCDEWLNGFQAFYDWSMANGYNDNLSIDRIDVNGNYEPSNCRWATKKEQANNTRRNRIIEFDGKAQTLQQWADEKGIRFNTIISRLSRGWTTEAALTTPVQQSSCNR